MGRAGKIGEAKLILFSSARLWGIILKRSKLDEGAAFVMITQFNDGWELRIRNSGLKIGFLATDVLFGV